MSNKLEIIIQTRSNIKSPLPPHVKEVLESLFDDVDKIRLEKEFGGGFSGTHVYLVQPILNQRTRLYVVVKVGKHNAILQEKKNYDEYISEDLSRTARIYNKIGYSTNEQWAGIRYSVGGDPYPTHTLLEHLKTLVDQATETEIVQFFTENLFPIVKGWWKNVKSEPAFIYSRSYDRLLPVRFILEPINEDENVQSSTVIDQAAGTYPKYDDNQGTQLGHLLKIVDFFVEEIDHEKKELTLNLFLFNQQDQFLPSYRIRVRGLGDLEGFVEGKKMPRAITGRIVETRLTLLQKQADPFLGYHLRSPKLTFDEETDVPNPLFREHFTALINTPHDVGLTSIHGDFNLNNILIDEKGAPTLIDFADTRYDHVLHDLMRLETGVITHILPQYLAEAAKPERIIYDLYADLHEPYQSSNLSYRKNNPQLKKIFVILQQIRKEAAELVSDKDNWSEYYDGLSLYLLGTLKFRNLQKTPAHPLAFWGAAALQKFSQEKSHIYPPRLWTSKLPPPPPPTDSTFWKMVLISIFSLMLGGILFGALTPNSPVYSWLFGTVDPTATSVSQVINTPTATPTITSTPTQPSGSTIEPTETPKLTETPNPNTPTPTPLSFTGSLAELIETFNPLTEISISIAYSFESGPYTHAEDDGGEMGDEIDLLNAMQAYWQKNIWPEKSIKFDFSPINVRQREACGAQRMVQSKEGEITCDQLTHIASGAISSTEPRCNPTHDNNIGTICTNIPHGSDVQRIMIRQDILTDVENDTNDSIEKSWNTYCEYFRRFQVPNERLKIGVINGTTADNDLQTKTDNAKANFFSKCIEAFSGANKSFFNDLELKGYDSREEIIKALKKGEISAYFTEQHILNFYGKSDENLIVKDVFSSDFVKSAPPDNYIFLLPEGYEGLRDLLDLTFRRMVCNGELDHIYSLSSEESTFTPQFLTKSLEENNEGFDCDRIDDDWEQNVTSLVTSNN